MSAPTPCPSLWSWPEGDDRQFLLSMLPSGIERITLEAQVDAVLERCWWQLMSGRTQLTDPPLAVNDVGPVVGRWLVANQALNSGAGPTWDCGACASLFVALCAALGIPARVVCASFGEENDVSAEYWNGQQWVHCLPYAMGRFRYGQFNLCASYKRWSLITRVKGSEIYRFDGRTPMHRAAVPFVQWWAERRFVDSAIIVNGNRYSVTGKHPVVQMQVWRDPLQDQRPNAWRGVDVSERDLYPDMSGLNGGSSSTSARSSSTANK